MADRTSRIAPGPGAALPEGGGIDAAAAPPSRAALILRATRPLYVPTSLVPALAGVLVAIGADGVRWALLPVALLALLLVHAGTDVINEVEDAARGVDSEDKLLFSVLLVVGVVAGQLL
jgi:1,4-dihydroxy-2-naphthoate octaprenyltransferase